MAARRAINARGVNPGAAGNISLRLGAGMLITPSGVDYDELAPDMILRQSTMRFHGNASCSKG